MKRQENDLFFKYKTKPITISQGIGFELPADYEPIPGDLVQLIISEGGTNGLVSYYGFLVCYRYFVNNEPFVGIEALNGKLRSDEGYIDLDSSSLIEQEGKKLIYLYGPGVTPPLIDDTAEHIVNMIVNRSKGIVELYYL